MSKKDVLPWIGAWLNYMSCLIKINEHTFLCGIVLYENYALQNIDKQGANSHH